MRCFVGLDLPHDLKSRLSGFMEGFGAGRVVAGDNLHVTLAFLDDQKEDTLEELHDNLSTLQLPQFCVQIDGFGAFGGQHPRIFYAAVTPSEPLLALHKSVRASARAAGIDLPHERFVPHVTLARFRRTDADAALPAIAARVGVPLRVEFRAIAFTLFASNLAPEGPRYDTLATYPLKAID